MENNTPPQTLTDADKVLRMYLTVAYNLCKDYNIQWNLDSAQYFIATVFGMETSIINKTLFPSSTKNISTMSDLNTDDEEEELIDDE